MKGNTIKVLIAGSRYTGKGQIGRAWGRTDADLPALQPVILYDRDVEIEGARRRVVAWVLSYDPEFEDLRVSFFKGADGVVFTFNAVEDPPISLEHLDAYVAELERVLHRSLPAVLVAVRLDPGEAPSPVARERGAAWAADRRMPMFEADFPDKEQFARVVDRAFATLVDAIMARARRDRTRSREGRLF